MTRKTQKSYEAVFDFINAKIFDLSGTKTFITDYEMAIRNALRKKYPRAKQTACLFHFAQAVRRKATKINGFVEFLQSNERAKKIYYQLMYIPLLPSNCIAAAFQNVCNKADAIGRAKFEPFIKYYRKQWIEKEGPRKISVFGKEVRTTSGAEGYNRSLNAYCHKKGSFLWLVVSLRNQSFMKSNEMSAFVRSGGLSCHKQKKEDKVNIFFVFVY